MEGEKKHKAWRFEALNGIRSLWNSFLRVDDVYAPSVLRGPLEGGVGVGGPGRVNTDQSSQHKRHTGLRKAAVGHLATSQALRSCFMCNNSRNSQNRSGGSEKGKEKKKKAWWPAGGKSADAKKSGPEREGALACGKNSKRKGRAEERKGW